MSDDYEAAVMRGFCGFSAGGLIGAWAATQMANSGEYYPPWYDPHRRGPQPLPEPSGVEMEQMKVAEAAYQASLKAANANKAPFSFKQGPGTYF